MMSLMEQAHMRALEKRIDELEARLAVVERAEAFEKSEVVPRRPGRPRKEANAEAHG